MSARIGDMVVIYPEAEQQCDDCGKIAELRPYGKNGAKICFECGEKNPVETAKNMGRILFGDSK